MAGLDNEPLTPDRERHDGAAMCRLCSSTDAIAGHAWCAASGGLVCDDCCRSLLLGDARQVPPTTASDLARRADMIISACLECERGQRWYTEQLRLHFADGNVPC